MYYVVAHETSTCKKFPLQAVTTNGCQTKIMSSLYLKIYIIVFELLKKYVLTWCTKLFIHSYLIPVKFSESGQFPPLLIYPYIVAKTNLK